MMPFVEPNPDTARPPLNRDEQSDVIDLALWTGQLLLQHGAQCERVEKPFDGW
ncbi:MAG: hypothetical protein HC876_11090 [Chloroflexaceae bacterium]|nr:hypothetical protein [Chloroflexaceae bacterium]